MSKAALLNANVGDFDAREPGREPARLRSPSHGEWPQGATHEGLTPAVVDNDRAAGVVERPRGDSGFHLAMAIGAIEQRTARSKRRTNDALAPFNRILERTVSERDRERVSGLAERVADIETRLVDRFPPVDENPVRAALARLEARLDTFGRQQSLAEAVALQQTIAQLPKPALQHDSLHRVEEKLDAILKAVQSRSTESSAIALAASQGARRWGERGIGNAIDEISRRQQTLDFDDGPRLSRQTAPRKIERTNPASKRDAADESASFAAIRTEIAGLAAKLDGLSRDVSSQRKPNLSQPVELDLLRADVAKMSNVLRTIAARFDLSSAIDSIGGLSERIGGSDDIGVGQTTRADLVSVVVDLRDGLVAMDGRTSVETLADRLDALAQKVDRLDRKSIDPSSIVMLRRHARDIVDLVATVESKPPVAERVDYLIGSLKWLLDTHADRSDADFQATIIEVRDLVANPPSQTTFARIETAVETLEANVIEAFADVAHAPSSDGQRSRTELENVVRDLSQKMEAVQAPGASHETLGALQNQIALLSSRFESADDGFAKLNELQQSMQDLFTHLEQTRASVETSAAKAAREVLRIAVEDGQTTHREAGLTERLAQIQAVQDEAEARNGSALSAVQQALTKVVDRLSSMESEIAEVREARKTRPAAKVTVAPLGEISLGTPVSLLQEVPTIQPAKKPSEAAVPAPAKPVVEADREDGKADFIAAARRAARAVQASLPASERKQSEPEQSGAKKEEGQARALLLEEAHDYMARHKKPVLLGMAALFVIIGTLSVAHRIGLSHRDAERVALATPIHAPTKVEASTPSTPHAPVDPRLVSVEPAKTMSGLTPAAAPSSAQPQRIAALPVFATRAPTPPPAPTIPVKLKTMADAGDPGAEYVLGTQYAEGRGVARDFETAASLYQKAADKGIVPAQYRLASLFEKGLGVAKDKAKARSLYMQAAEAGNPRAMHNLAVLLADGDGTPDYQGAATWFRKAAQYGMEDSQYNLAILLARGLGVQQSLVQSYQWFAVAAAQDDPEAAKKRDEVGSKLGGADLAVAKALAASFRPRAVSVAATVVQPPPGGWDGASPSSPLKTARSKISSL